MSIFDKIGDFFGDIFGAIGDALSWLLGVPDADDYAGQLINKNSNVANLPVVYGRRLIGGTRVFVSTGGNKKNQYMYIVLTLSEGEIEEISKVYVNDKLMTGSAVSGKPYKKVTTGDYKDIIWYQTFTGTDNQAACTTLFNDIGSGPDDTWGANHKLNGVAYIAMVVRYHQDKGMTSIPEIKCELKGKRVYDPRSETTGWTSNPALCLRDYLTNDRYGKGLPDSAIDDTAFGAAADFCDDTVTSYTGGPDINTFNLNMILDTGNTLFDNTKRFLLAMRGIMPYTQGKYSLIIDKDDSSVGTIDESICTRDITIKSVNKNTKLNQVKAVFVNPNKRYEQDSVIWPPAESSEESTFLAEDNNQVLSKDLTLDTVTDFYQARELARVAVLASRSSSIICEVVCTSEALKYAVGDIVTLEQPSMGWVDAAAKEFRILSIQLAVSGEVGLTLQEYDSSIYPWVESSEQDDQPETTLPNPNSVDAITTASVTTGSQVLNDGTIQYYADLTWTEPDDELIQDYVIKINKKVGSTTTNNVETVSTINNKYRYILTDTDAEYGYTIQARNGAQVVSDELTVTPTAVVVDTTAPGNITDFNAVGKLQQIELRWTNPTDADFDLVNIKVADAAEPEPTELYAQVRSDTFTHEVGAYSTEKFYWVAPVDSSGNVGSYTGPESATTGTIDYGDVLNPPTIPEIATTVYLTLSDSNAPTDAEFNTAVGRDPIENDFVVVSYEALVEGETVTRTKAYVYKTVSPAEVPDWTEVAEYIDGSMLVSGSLSASDITTGTLNAKDVTISNLTITSGQLPSDVVYNSNITDVVRDGDITDVVRQEQTQSNVLIDEDVRTLTIPYPVTEAEALEYIINSPSAVNEALIVLDILDAEGVTVPNGVQWSLNGVYQSQLNGPNNARVEYKFVVPLVSGNNSIKIWSGAGDGGTVYSVKSYTFASNGGQWFRLSGRANTNAPSEADFKTAFGREPAPRDVILVESTTGDTASYYFNKTTYAWDNAEAIVHGDLIVSESITALGEVTAGTFSLGNGAFNVNSSGQLSATGAIISGDITAGSINAENITFTGSLIADGLSTIPNVEALNMTQSLRNAIEEIIVTKFGSDASTGYYDEATGTFDINDDDTEICRISNFDHNGSSIDIDLTFSKTFQSSTSVTPSVVVKIERSPVGAETWTTIKTQTVTGSSFYEPEVKKHIASISGVVSVSDNPAVGDYDYRFLTGDVLDLATTIITARLEANEQGEQIGTIDLANYGALAQDETVTGNWTFNGTIDSVGEKYRNTNNEYAIDLNNSDIIGANAIWFDDSATGNEGINFYRSAGLYDNLRANAGALYFSTNVNNDATTADSVNTVYHSGNFTPSDKADLSGDTFTGAVTVQHSGTIGLSTASNGYLKVTDGTDTLAFDPNEIFSTIDINISTQSGDIDFRPSTGIVRVYNSDSTSSGDITSTTISNWNSAYTYSQAGHLPLTGGTVTGLTSFVGTDVGGGTSTYADFSIKDVDAHLDITSNSAGTWGSAINLRETDGTNFVNTWSIARNTGTSANLNFNFGTVDDHNVGGIKASISSTGVISATGGNSTEWNTGYDYSQIGHLPLTGGTLTGNLTLNSATPEILFNGTSDAGVDMAIKATPEGLDFYEPEDVNKIHFQILDDTGVNAPFGYQVSGATVIDSNLNATFAGGTYNGQLIVDGGTGVDSSGTFHLRQKGDTVNDGMAITSSFSTAHRIWKDASGVLNFGIGSTPNQFGMDTSGNFKVGGQTVINASRNLANIGTISSSNVVAVSGLDTGNPQADGDTTRVSGYGINGNRGTYYITNSGGTVQIGNGSVHNNNPTCTFSTSAVALASNRVLQVGGSTVIDASKNITSGSTINTANNSSGHSKIELGTRGAGGNANGRTVLIEGTAEPTNGEGNGRIFFAEHNSTTASADNYGVSFGYCGNVGTAFPSGVTPAQNSNGYWYLAGHDNNATGTPFLYGFRDGSSIVANAHFNISGSHELQIGGTQVISSGRYGSFSGIQSSGTTRFSAGTNYFGGTTSNTAEIQMNTGNAGSPFITFTDNQGDMTWSMGGDDADNHFKLHGNYNGTIPNINNLATPQFEWQNNGNFIAQGNITAYSDERLKGNIKVIDNALSKVSDLKGVTFDKIYEEEDTRYTGVIAQDVEKVLPEAVMEQDNGYKSVAYGNMVGLLIEAIKELKSEIEELKNGTNSD